MSNNGTHQDGIAKRTQTTMRLEHGQDGRQDGRSDGDGKRQKKTTIIIEKRGERGGS